MLVPTKVILPTGSPPQLIKAIRSALLVPQDGTKFKKGNSPFYYIKASDV